MLLHLFTVQSFVLKILKIFCFKRTVTYSGVEGGKQGDNWKYPQFVGEKAVDGDDSTRWSADKTDNQSDC